MQLREPTQRHDSRNKRHKNIGENATEQRSYTLDRTATMVGQTEEVKLRKSKADIQFCFVISYYTMQFLIFILYFLFKNGNFQNDFQIFHRRDMNIITEDKAKHPILLRNFKFCVEVFKKYSNSNSIFYPSMEYSTFAKEIRNRNCNVRLRLP